MICSNCIHYEVCQHTYNICKKTGINYFKDKSQYTERPCKVGDRVYIICYKRNVQPYIRVETVLHMNYLQGKSLDLWQIHTEYAAYNAKDVIYSKSEAEKKLKELKENA